MPVTRAIDLDDYGNVRRAIRCAGKYSEFRKFGRPSACCRTNAPP